MKRTISNFLFKSRLLIKDKAPIILAGCGVMGTVATAILSAKSAVEYERCREYNNSDIDEKRKIAVKCFTAPVIAGTATVFCIIGSAAIGYKQKTEVTTAYLMLAKSYKDYRNKVKELSVESEGLDSKVTTSTAIDRLRGQYIELDDGNELFYDEFSDRFFKSTMTAVRSAEYHFNRNFVLRDYASLNEFYEFLGLSDVEFGDFLGWSMYVGEINYGYRWVDFDHEKVMMDDGSYFYKISMPFAPTADYFT